MLKYLLLLNFITFSFQIDNCWRTEKICKSCKSGYTLIAPYDYWTLCQKNELTYLGEANDPCLVYSDSAKTYCQFCKKGYLMTDNYKCKEAPENCERLENGKCVECSNYFKLTEDNKCEKTSCYEYKDGVCECNEGFYLVEKKECKKIPIKYCAEWDGNTCTDCYEIAKKEGNECKLIEGYDDDDDEDEEKINIEHCSYLDVNNRTKCGGCEDNYDLNDDQTKCISVCTSTEEICYHCNDNYYNFDGKTCSIIDPDYKESSSKLIKYNLVVLSMILFFIF